MSHDSATGDVATTLAVTGAVTVTGPDGTTYSSPGDIDCSLAPTERST